MLLYSDITRSSPCLFVVLTALPQCYKDPCCAEVIDARPTEIGRDSQYLRGVWFEDDLFLARPSAPEEGGLLGWGSLMATGGRESLQYKSVTDKFIQT